MFNVPPDTKQVISDMFFPANHLAQYWRTKPNTTKGSNKRTKQSML